MKEHEGRTKHCLNTSAVFRASDRTSHNECAVAEAGRGGPESALKSAGRNCDGDRHHRRDYGLHPSV